MSNSLPVRLKHALERQLLARRLRQHFAQRDFSFISSNCLGGRFSQLLDVQYRSPTVGLYFYPGDFLNFVSDLPRNLQADVDADEPSSAQQGYPVGVVNACKIHFMHYASFAAAKQKWNERKSRVDLAKAIFIFTDRDGATYQDLLAFDELPFERKMLFVHRPYPELRSAIYIKGFERAGQVGELYSLSHYLNSALTSQKLQEYLK